MSSTSTSRPLTKAQIEYAADRIRVIRNEKVIAYSETLPKIPDAPPAIVGYSNDEKMAFIHNGKANLRKAGEIYYRTDLVEAFTYPERKRSPADIKKQEAHDKAVSARCAAVVKFNKILDKKVTALQDKLHLGDSAATLALIEAFAAE